MLALCIDAANQTCSELFISSAQALRNTIHLLTNVCFFVKNIPRKLFEIKRIWVANWQRTVSTRDPGTQTSHVVQYLIRPFKSFAAFNFQACSINLFEEGKQPLCRR